MFTNKMDFSSCVHVIWIDFTNAVTYLHVCVYICTYVCELIWKTNQVVTFGISRNTDFKYSSYCGSLVLDCSYARYTV